MPRPFYLPVNHTFGWANNSTGEREINVLHGAHSPPARPKINGVIYTLQARPALEQGPATSSGARAGRTPHTPSPAIALPKPPRYPQSLLLRGEDKAPPATRMLSSENRPQRPQRRLQHLPPYRSESIQGRNPQRGESPPGTAKPTRGISEGKAIKSQSKNIMRAGTG